MAYGFTFLELLAVVVVLVLLIALVLPAVAPRNRRHGRQFMDEAKVRGIHQGMVLFAQNNNERYPLPSVLDKADHTVALAAGTDPTAKDTTSNIFSVLIYGTFVGTWDCVSPSESNGAITQDAGYESAEPSGAVDRKLALWDPGFNADFTGSGSKGREGGHFSYAHMLPSGPRRATWTITFQGTQAVVGSRGPWISGLDAKHKGAFDTKSNTLLIHGGPTTWEGNIAYNDNHVEFETALAPETCPYTDGQGKTWFDHLFFDEQDDAKGVNNFLGNFNAAGPAPAAFKAVWD